MTCKNHIELVGVVGAVRVAQLSDTRNCRLSIATNRAYRDNNGNAVIRTA